MKTYYFIPILSLFLLVVSCKPEKNLNLEYRSCSIRVEDFLIETENYDMEGNITGTSVRSKSYHTPSTTLEDWEHITFSTTATTYHQEWDLDGLNGNDSGFLELTVSGLRVYKVTTFEFKQTRTSNTGSVTQLTITGGNVPEHTSINPTGFLFGGKLATVCTYIYNIDRKSYRSDGTISSKVIGFQCDDESELSLFLNQK